MKLPLDLSFKGMRTYIQGPDMLNAAVAAVAHQIGAIELTQFNFIINSTTSRSLCLMVGQEKQRVLADQMPVATLSFKANGLSWQGVLVEESGEPTCRHSYDEESIVALCRISQAEGCITLEGELMFTPIEVIVAMTKALHQALYPEAPGKWLFCRWESECWPIIISLSGISIVLGTTLGSRLTKSAVMLDGERIGWVYFSAKANP